MPIEAEEYALRCVDARILCLLRHDLTALILLCGVFLADVQLVKRLGARN